VGFGIARGQKAEISSSSYLYAHPAAAPRTGRERLPWDGLLLLLLHSSAPSIVAGIRGGKFSFNAYSQPTVLLPLTLYLHNAVLPGPSFAAAGRLFILPLADLPRDTGRFLTRAWRSKSVASVFIALRCLALGPFVVRRRSHLFDGSHRGYLFSSLLWTVRA